MRAPPLRLGALVSCLLPLVCHCERGRVLEAPLGVVVTGVSANHLREAWGLVHTAQQHLPAGWLIAVYDLVGDLPKAEQLRVQSWCRVEYHRMSEVVSVAGPVLCPLQSPVA
jgi:hypothetical protein